MAKAKKEKIQNLISAPSYNKGIGLCNKIIGLDLSLTGSGWCSITWSSTPEIHFGLLDPIGIQGPERMDWVLNKIKEVVTPGSYTFIEDFSFGSKGSALSEIHGLGWLVRWYLWKSGIPYMLVAPTTLKKFATGKGNSDKNIVLKEVYKQWGPLADFSDDNICDAFVLAKIGYAVEWPNAAGLKAHQKEIVDKLIGV